MKIKLRNPKTQEIIEKLLKRPLTEGNGGNKLNLGCGKELLKGYINVDKYKPYDIMVDIEKIPYPFKDNKFEEIICSSTLEHISKDKQIKTIMECHRILKIRGILILSVPYYHSLLAYNTLLHKSPEFSLDTFNQFDVKQGYNIDNESDLFPRFKIKKEAVPSKFGEFIPRKIRVAISHCIGNVIDSIICIMEKVETHKKTQAHKK